MGSMIDFPSNGRSASGYLAPSAATSARGVVVIQEWWGLNDHIKKVADRFSGEGFTALAPDLYDGKVTRSPDEAQKLLMALDIAGAERQLRGAVAELRRRTGRPVGTVGFCMGGALSLFTACANGSDVSACVVYYGGHPKVTYDFDGLRAAVLGHWAEDDAFANANIPIIESALSKRKHAFEFHHYPRTKHAFFNDERPAYDRDAAKLSFERTIAFFRKHL